jgi:hypothetical protein
MPEGAQHSLVSLLPIRALAFFDSLQSNALMLRLFSSPMQAQQPSSSTKHKSAITNYMLACLLACLFVCLLACLVCLGIDFADCLIDCRRMDVQAERLKNLTK